MFLLRRVVVAAAAALSLVALPATAQAGLLGGIGDLQPPTTTVTPLTAQPGDQLTCSNDQATAYRWKRNGTQIAQGATYTASEADIATLLVCEATTSTVWGTVGSAPVVVLPLEIVGDVTDLIPPEVIDLLSPEVIDLLPSEVVDALPGGQDGTGDPGSGDGGDALGKPTNSAAPGLSGTARVGKNLTCTRGTWTGNPSVYLYRWARGSELIPGAESERYRVAAADSARRIRCAVAAGNSAGYGIAMSRAVKPKAVADSKRPVIGKFKFKPRRLVLEQAKGKFTWRLSEAARSTIVLQRCKKVARDGKKCKRWKRVGRLTKASKRGKNKAAFKGKVGKRWLKAGRYRATLVAKDAAGNKSKRRTAKLTLKSP